MYTIVNKSSETKKLNACPAESTLRLLDGKWKLNIIYRLDEANVLRFGELKRLLPGITQRMLTAQLRELEERGVIARKVYPVVPPKVEYSLTELGKSLRPVLDALRKWSLEHDK